MATNEIFYDPKTIIDYDWSQFDENGSKILVKLIDQAGSVNVYEMKLILLPSFVEELPVFKATAGRTCDQHLPKIVGSYKPIDLELEIAHFNDSLSYNSTSNSINYKPKTNDGYELRDFFGESTITIKLEDDEGNKSSYEMFFFFVVPLMFDSDLPTFNVTAGKYAEVLLPDVIIEEGFFLSELTVQPEVEILSQYIFYDKIFRKLVYDPSGNQKPFGMKEFEFAGDSLITVKLIDTFDIEYIYQMKLSLTCPLSFDEEL